MALNIAANSIFCTFHMSVKIRYKKKERAVGVVSTVT